MVEPLFTSEAVAKLRTHIQKTVDNLLDKMIKEGSSQPVDLVEKFALPLPSYVSPPLTKNWQLKLTTLRLFMAYLVSHSKTLNF